jgi:hypothetical protein
MGRVKGIFTNFQKKVDAVFYRCEYLKECDKVAPQCWEGGNSYCGEWRKRTTNKKNRL